jgi:bile acid-coenzyme A ligase
MGWMDEEGYVYLADRRTDLILRGGANIYPAEVEAALDAHPDVGSSVAIGLPDAEMGQRVHAIVQPKAHASGRLNAADLEQFLTGRIARYKVPEKLRVYGELFARRCGKGTTFGTARRTGRMVPRRTTISHRSNRSG